MLSFHFIQYLFIEYLLKTSSLSHVHFTVLLPSTTLRAFQVALVVKNQPANAGDVRDVGLTPGLGRSPGRGHGNPFQYSCLENPMGRGAWQAVVHRVAQSQT